MTAFRITLAIATDCGSVSSTDGRDALPDYELLELLLFWRFRARDTKPLAKELIAEFGPSRRRYRRPPSG